MIYDAVDSWVKAEVATCAYQHGVNVDHVMGCERYAVMIYVVKSIHSGPRLVKHDPICNLHVLEMLILSSEYSKAMW